MKVVLDTNIVVAALRSRQGASNLVLAAAAQRQFNFVISVPLMLEYEAVLKRPANLEAIGISVPAVDKILNGLCAMGDEIKIHYLWRPQLSDPKDDMVLEAAVNGRADAIVTFNAKDFGDAAERLNIALMTPGDLLQRLKQEI